MNIADKVYLTQNGQLVIEAEAVTPVGYWKRTSVDGETGLLWDAPQSSLSKAPDGQTLSYNFKTDEAGNYRIALRSGRIQSAIDSNDPGGDSRGRGDTLNNDVYVSIINAKTNEVIQAPTRLFTGLSDSSDGELAWGNTFDPSNGKQPIPASIEGTRSKVSLEADTEYRLEITGRSDGYVVDRITLRSDSHLNDTDAHRAPLPNGEVTPEPQPPAEVDLTQYPAMKEWSNAGVEGGVPDNLRVVKTIQPSDDIQSAVKEVSAAGGGVLLLRKGTYSVDAPIDMEDNVVIRGEDRDAVRIESTIRATKKYDRHSTFIFQDEQYAGLENLTLDYKEPGIEPQVDMYESNVQRDDLYVHHIAIRENSSNNWVKGVNVLNAGTDPILVSGNHNTLTNNYIEGAHNKGGGNGYYRILGAHNLIKGETVKNIRHFSILGGRAEYNVVTDSYFETDINFHLGDGGNNLIEGNTVNVPSWHRWWPSFGTGGPYWSHLPPGDKNVVVNNRTFHGYDGESPFSQANVVYTFEGYGAPVATNWEMPKGGRFYVPEGSSESAPQPTPEPTPTPNHSISVEAESMQLSGEYWVESINAASGNKVISLRGGATEGAGAAKFNFNGSAGEYDVKIHYFDENDGMGQLKLKQGNQQIASFNLDKQLGSALADAKTLTTTEVKGVSIKAGDSFTLEGFEDGTATTAEHLRIDKIEFTPVAESTVPKTDTPPNPLTPTPLTSAGSATVSVIKHNNDVQSSNYDNNSFVVTNTGDKAIAKVEIDTTNALYPDIVFDPFGKGGDTIAKPLTIGSNEGTGVVAPNASSYIGAGGTAGYNAIQLLFDSNVDGGFNPGEKMSFAVDMDPNSIAGATKPTLEGGATANWHVGGVSGAEMIGSQVKITFTDGSVATGQLQSTGTQAGSQALATQAPAAKPVSLKVNGLASGGIGLYSAGGPRVTVQGEAGQMARVVLTKGFIQPVTNNFTGAYKNQLEVQLDTLRAANFPANNAVEFQTVDILLNGDVQDISDKFNFADVALYNFAGEDKLPLGFVASVIDVDNDNLPVSDVIQPIYLQFNPAATVAEAMRINAGGDAFTDSDGNQWSADQFFKGGNLYSTAVGIDSTQDDALFQTERYGKQLDYDIPVANGDYTVNLSFAEIYWNQANQRVFDVKAEDKLVLDNVDVHVGAGGKNIAMEKSFNVTVQDGVLNLDLTASVNNVKISGIEIVPA